MNKPLVRSRDRLKTRKKSFNTQPSMVELSQSLSPTQLMQRLRDKDPEAIQSFEKLKEKVAKPTYYSDFDALTLEQAQNKLAEIQSDFNELPPHKRLAYDNDSLAWYEDEAYVRLEKEQSKLDTTVEIASKKDISEEKKIEDKKDEQP